MIAVTFILLIYLFFVLYLLRTLSKPRSDKHHTKLSECGGLSIVIPFRNEESNLENLLNSLSIQDFQGPIECLLINDGSTDCSVEIIERFIPTIPFTTRIMSSKYNQSCPLTSKQQALDLGIRNARFDWVALTDADMQLSPGWLRALNKSATQDTSLVFGHTSLISRKSLFEKFQAFQLDFLFSVAYVFHWAGIRGSCMGNNLLISRKAYMQSGGFSKIGYSIVEDRALYSHFLSQKREVRAAEPFLPLAFTYPTETAVAFIHQMIRWARGGLKWGSNLLPVAILFTAQNITLILCCTTLLPVVPTVIAISNFLITWLLVAYSFKKTGSTQNPLFFPIFFVALLIESILFACLLLFRQETVWKGRKV